MTTMGEASRSPLSVAECDSIITGPGSVLEMETLELHGRRVRVWKNLPPTFRHFLLGALETYAERPFVSSPLDGIRSTPEPRESLTFGDVRDRAVALAAWLRCYGVRKGCRVALGGANSAQWIISFVAVHLVGAVPVLVNASLHHDALVHCLSITRPILVLVDTDVAACLGPSRALLKHRRVGNVYCWSSITNLSEQARFGILEIGEIDPPAGLVRDVLSGADLETLGPESDGSIFFTSGTSGAPKAVLSTQRMGLSNIFSGLVAPARAALRAGRSIPPLPKASDPQRTVLLSIPLFHVTGCLSWLMRSFFGGTKLVLMRRWSVSEAVRLVQTERVSVIGGVPAVVASILQSPLLPKDVKFDTIFYGGAPPPERLARDVRARWPLAGLVQGYGMTETNAYVCSVAGPDYLQRPGSTGPPVPICDIRIVDPATRDQLSTGELGLLLVRGPQVMKSYLGDSAATRAVLDDEGWLDTGDLGSVDSEGFLYIRDRLKDVIIRGGENIASAEVENALYADDRVAEAAAIALPDPILGERVGAAVSLVPGASATASDLITDAASRNRLRRAAVPVAILVHPGPLPRNVNGKILKADIRALVLAEWERTQRLSIKAKL